MNLRLKRTPGIYVVGFMASGKSTIGRHLAHRLGWSFFDTDDEIEAAEKMTIADIFTARGEPDFRRIETEIIRQHVGWIERGRPAVLALGGGAFAESPNRDLLENNGVTVWLDCPFEVVKRRVGEASHRPLARDPEKFAALYESRREVYRLADVGIPIESDDPNAVVEAILGHALFR
jgi:shikimate kinase